jgi:Family of unknown function (DUF6173)
MPPLISDLSRTVFPALPRPIGPRNPAEKAVERLGEQIAAFESSLTPEEEVGAILIGAPGGIVFHMTRIYAINMDLLGFEGLNEHRKPLRLVQHVTQLSILLTALPKLDSEARRIGFDFSKSKDRPAISQPQE